MTTIRGTVPFSYSSYAWSSRPSNAALDGFRATFFVASALIASPAFAQKTKLTVYTALETDQLKAYQAAFKPCQAHFAAQAAVRRDNLEARKSVLERAVSLIAA
mgnify:CR=1 FL=1